MPISERASVHQALSGLRTNDISIQLGQRNIASVKDATAGPDTEDTQAAYVNYGLIPNEVVNTQEIVFRPRDPPLHVIFNLADTC